MYKAFNFFIVTVIFLFTGLFFVNAGNNGNSYDYLWSEKLGYISLGGDDASVDYGVTVADATLSGYAWSEITGWINFNDSGSLYAVTNDGNGNLSGYAWSEKLGYISFDDGSANNYYQVTIDCAGNLSGYAWSEKAGYINMNDSGAFYQATTTWISAPIVTTENVSNNSSRSTDGNGNITCSGSATTRGFKYALTSTSSCDTWDVNEGGSFGTGSFSLPITGLTKNTTYYYRAYAVNAQGYGYGACLPFTTEKEVVPIIFNKGVILKNGTILK